MNCTNQQPPQRGVAVPNRIYVDSKWLLAFPRVPDTPGTTITQTIFSPRCPLNDRRRAALSFFKISCLSSLFSCLSLARFLNLLLPLMRSNVHPNPCPDFSCSMCAGNVTSQGRSVQCCTCSEWVCLKCSLLSFSRFRTLGSSYSWSCPPCCVPASLEDSTPTGTVTSSSNSSSLYTYRAQSGPPLLMQHSHPTLAFKSLYPFSAHFVSSPSLHLRHRLMFLAVSL